MTPAEVEPRLRAAMQKAVDQGWRLVRGETYRTYGKRCCALGAFAAIGECFLGDERSDYLVDHLAEFVGIPTVRGSSKDACAAFVDGFDGEPRVSVKHVDWYDLGAKLAQEFCT